MTASLTKIWEHPDISSTNIERFRELANKRYGLRLETYSDLWKWSTEQLNDFWMLVWDFTKVQASIQPACAISTRESSKLYPPPRWFPGARLNFAQNILESAFVEQGRLHKPVLIGIREGADDVENVTLSQLRDRVGVLANMMRQEGVEKGDRVACIGANSIDTFTILLAAASIGAIFTCCSPETGAKGILDRFLQVRPKMLFADDWAVYNGKRVDCQAKVEKVAVSLRKQAGLQTVVVVPRFKGRGPALQASKGFYSLATLTAGVSSKLQFAQLDFAHPFIIVYSSGTTGQPKCLAHTLGGVLIKQKLEQILCMDMSASSVHFQYSSTSWIMHIYSISGLLSGARSILYDGSPTKPTALRLPQLLAQERVTHFGTSAHYLHLLEQTGFNKGTVPGLDALKVITSTGSVLRESQFHWVLQAVGPVHLMSMSGGTDIAGSFVAGAPNLPVYAGWCQARTMGMKVQIYSDEGQAIENTGEPGELVCTVPSPSQPAFFWGDHNGQRYQAAYFDKFPGVWAQGDFVRMDPDTQGILFLGRSDGVLNPSGVRFGSAEIYNSLVAFPEVEDSLCVGQRRPQDRDERVLLFVKMKPGHRFTQQLKTAIETRIRRDLSPRHVPRLIVATPDIPMTATGKKTEVPVKKIVSGQKIQPSSTLVNPEALKWYESFGAPDGEGGHRKDCAKL